MYSVPHSAMVSSPLCFLLNSRCSPRLGPWPVRRTLPRWRVVKISSPFGSASLLCHSLPFTLRVTYGIMCQTSRYVLYVRRATAPVVSVSKGITKYYILSISLMPSISAAAQCDSCTLAHSVTGTILILGDWIL